MVLANQSVDFLLQDLYRIAGFSLFKRDHFLGHELSGAIAGNAARQYNLNGIAIPCVQLLSAADAHRFAVGTDQCPA